MASGRAPLYFHNIDGFWKLDYGRTFNMDYRARRRHTIPGDTREQAFCEGEKIFVDGYNLISDDLEKGKIDDAGALQLRIFGVMADLTKEFPDISVNCKPR